MFKLMDKKLIASLRSKSLLNFFLPNFNRTFCKTPFPLNGDSATIRNFGQKDANRSRNDKSAVEAQ